MKKLFYRIGLIAALGASVLAVETPTVVEANHNVCSPHVNGDDLASWPAGGCRNFIVDSGPGALLDRAGLLARQSTYTSPEANFTRNFLWYSYEKPVTVNNPNVKWASCDGIPGYGNACANSDIEADFYGKPHPAGDGFVLKAYDYPASITFSAFEFNGHWIAKSCGNWKDVPERTNPVPYFDGIKFRDNNRDGAYDPALEQKLAGWDIKITRESSLVGQGGGSWTVPTNANGYYRFDLDGHGPGRYRIEEIMQPGWKNSTPISYTIDVGFGIGDQRFTRDFGNAETVVDVAKTDMRVLDEPAFFDANTPTDVTVSVTIENLGPADQVPVEDELIAVLPPDCTTPNPRRTFTVDPLRRGHPVTREFVFTITCTRPSPHDFRFDDEVVITDPDIIDINPLNNRASTGFMAPVHAYTDLGVGAVLTCPDETDVGVPTDCDVDITVTNDGFDDVDATVAAQLALPDDCVSDPDLATLDYDGLADPDSVTQTQTFTVTCSHRSFHEIEVSAAVTADDVHVFDTNPANDTGGDGPSIMEVFHDATMAVNEVHLTCDETLGQSPFTCSATVEYQKTGPAPMVEVVLYADLGDTGDCSAAPDPYESQTFVLDGSQPEVRTFTWTMTCPLSDVLHPFWVTTDIGPSENEPHAEDDPGPVMDHWEVPYCLPTVNPHGNNQPQAPGNGNQGQNQDGFYIFGMLPNDVDEAVRIRDTESGAVFGPFANGTRIKWVEANGADPFITEMGGNNGNGKGQALAVDYQIHARGDAQAFFVDEKGVEVSVTCLVPPFPQ